MQIIPIKDLRDTNKISDLCNESNEPIFVTKNTIDAGTSRLVGKEQEHLKLDLRDPSNSSVMGGIAFKMGHFFDTLKSKKPIDVCYTLEENFFAGNTTIQLMVREIQKSEENSDVWVF